MLAAAHAALAGMLATAVILNSFLVVSPLKIVVDEKSRGAQDIQILHVVASQNFSKNRALVNYSSPKAQS